jgi:hypothetical protein
VRLGALARTGTTARNTVDELASLTGRVAYPDGTPTTRFAIPLGTALPVARARLRCIFA